jgi:hypothetical protein
MSLVWSVAKVIVGAPFAMVGAVVHAIPYQVIKRVAKTPSNEGMKATVKLLGCFAAFSLLLCRTRCRRGRVVRAGGRTRDRARLSIVRLRRRSVLREGEEPRKSRGRLPHGPACQLVDGPSAPPRRRGLGQRVAAEDEPVRVALYLLSHEQTKGGQELGIRGVTRPATRRDSVRRTRPRSRRPS